MSSIYGAATSLLEEEDRLDKSERHELAQSIADETERLNQVVTNLLEMTRLEEGLDIKRDWQPLEEIIVSALTNTKKLLGSRMVATNIPSDLPLIYADGVLLEQLFINLLENAAKYTPPESRIGISAVPHGQKLLVFLHAAMKRETPRPIFRAGRLEVDFRHRRVRVSGKNVHLTPLEYRILSLLIDNAGRTLTYERLLQAWTSQKRRGVEHIRVLVAQLRQKLESDPQKPRLLVNAPRIGYQFQLRGR